MDPLMIRGYSFRKVLLFFLVLTLFACTFISAYTQVQSQSSRRSSPHRLLGRRRLLDIDEEDQEEVDLQVPIIKKKTSTSTTTKLSIKNQTKLTKPTTSSSSTKLIKTTNSASKNQTTKLIKLSNTDSLSVSTKNKTKLTNKPTSSDSSIALKSSQLNKKLNSTTSKASNSTKTTSSLLTKKSSDLSKTGSSKNKTSKAVTDKELEKLVSSSTSTDAKSKNQDKQQSSEKKPKSDQKPQNKKKQTQPSWIEDEEEDDLVSEFRDLPSRFQETLLPDLERISSTSKVYLNRANKEITRGFKPYVGNKYASTVASIVSFAFIIIPFILVSLIFNRIKAYFSLQKLLIFIQVYLSIYFSILCFSSLATGLEPLRFFYATSQSTYVCLQVFQTLAYVLYLLLLLMYLVLVFSTETGLATKLLGLGQTFVGFAVGLHYYMTVFHRAVLRQPPKTSWRVHALYATCFLVICLLGKADRRKKAYLEEGGEEGKKS